MGITEFTLAFQIACQFATYSCEKLEPPRVEIVENLKARGEFVGPNIIHLSLSVEREPGLSPWITLVHEMVHYIDYQSGNTDFSDAGKRCNAEAYAWQITDAWLATIGHAGEKTNWRVFYPECRTDIFSWSFR